MVKSHFEWLTYNEPESHLDDLVSRLCGLAGICRDSRIVGLTYKDDSMLARFKRLGYTDTYRYQMNADLGLHDRCAGLESIQAALDESMASTLAVRHGRADILIIRHVLEHAHDPALFLRAARTLVKPGGYLVFEVPDCRKFIRACDYSFIWEEHIFYFTPQTLAALVSRVGLTMRELIIFPYPLEDSLIGIVHNDSSPDVRRPTLDELDAALVEGRAFGGRFSERRIRLQTVFHDWHVESKRVAIFGAGHLAAKFVNVYSLRDLIECVIDDNSRKQALLMPGSRLPIRGSSALNKIDLCPLSLNPESERKVMAKNQPFLDRGGRFLSIFVLSPKSVYNAEAA